MEKLKEKVIKTDEDTAIEEKGNGGIYPYDPAYSDIDINDTPFSVFEYLRQLDKGKIKIDPDFQRNKVWKNEQKSKFIESVLLNFPLPPIYLNETKDAEYIVIDGLQRTTALNDFYKGYLILEGLEALPVYNGLTFESLKETLQSKFERKKLTVFTLKPSTPMVVIYDLFNRINTGGTQLNRQEVRNCIYIGRSTTLLKELAMEEFFKKAVDEGVSDERMKAREVILRYIAFRWFDFKTEYSGDMSKYIESAMKNINKMNGYELDKIKKDFKRVMEISYLIWGKKNFRIPTKSTRGMINTAVLETVCNYLSSKNDNFININKGTIKKNYFHLIKNEVYLDCVTSSTGSKTKVLDRFSLTYKILNQNTL